MSADSALPILEWLLTHRTSTSSDHGRVALPQLFSRFDDSAHPLVWHATMEDWGAEHLAGVSSVALSAVQRFDVKLHGAHIAHVASSQPHGLSLWIISSHHLARLQVEVYIAVQPPDVSIAVFERRSRPQSDSFADRLERRIAATLDAKFQRVAFSETPSPSSLQNT